PTQALVVHGTYRYVRNPMYLAVTATILGQALLLGRPALLAYAAVVAGAMATFVYLYEEPTLTARYGPHSESYCATPPPPPSPAAPPPAALEAQPSINQAVRSELTYRRLWRPRPDPARPPRH